MDIQFLDGSLGWLSLLLAVARGVCVCVLKAREKQHGRGVQQPVELALRTKRAEDLYFRVRGKDRSKSRDRRTNECGLD